MLAVSAETAETGAKRNDDGCCDDVESRKNVAAPTISDDEVVEDRRVDDETDDAAIASSSTTTRWWPAKKMARIWAKEAWHFRFHSRCRGSVSTTKSKDAKRTKSPKNSSLEDLIWK